MNEVVSFVLNLASQHAIFVYLLAFFVSFFESFFLIGEFIPGAVFAFGSGVVASKGSVDVYILIICGVVGAILADLASYYLAILFYDRIKERSFIKRQDKLFEKGIIFFKKFGGLSVFVGRFVGLLRPIIPFIAGIFKMNNLEFTFWAILSGVVWGVVYFGAGYAFGMNMELIKEFLMEFNFALVGVVVLIFGLYFVIRKLNAK